MVVNLPKLVKPAVSETVICTLAGPTGVAGEGACRKLTVGPGRSDEDCVATSNTTNWRREYITLTGSCRKSEELVVAMKWGNAHGAKGFRWS